MKSILVVLAVILSVTPGFAQTPAAPQATQDTHVGRSFWPGVMLAIAGSTVAILGGTALKSDDYTSGNTPLSAFPQCEAMKSNPVYAGNACDLLKGPNLRIVWSGVGAAALGVTLMAIGSAHSRIEVGPRSARFVYRKNF
jgi:hypothetical protein